uniref:Glycosyltransferase n=1 Tax=viral metagenome TaxID=1070528 RepID=A0A6C0B740_9ZZZZ
MEIGAYLQCYKNPYATYKCLEQFRRFYPNGTVVLLSDNGYNYSNMAEFFNCIYIHCDENLWLTYRDVDSNGALVNSKKLVRRVYDAFEMINEEYIMWLEDDVIINGPIRDEFRYDINGYCPNKLETSILCKRYKNLDSNRTYRFSGHGGTVFHKSNTLSAFLRDDILNDVVVNWSKYALPVTIGQDYLFSILVTVNNGTIGPYNGHGERYNDRVEPSIIVQHQYKYWYGKPMPSELNHLISFS